MATRRRYHPPISWEHSQEHGSNTVHLAMEERRSDYHCYKNFVQRTCLCSDDRCLLNWKRWVDLHDDKRCGFITLPLVPKIKNTPLGRAKMAFLGAVYRHLRGNGFVVPERDGDSRFYVAYHHFHPSLLHPKNKGPVSIVDSKQGEDLNFTESDKLPATDVVESGCFAAPNYVMANIELDLRAEERSAGINQEDSSLPAASRKLPWEREMERLER